MTVKSIKLLKKSGWFAFTLLFCLISSFKIACAYGLGTEEISFKIPDSDRIIVAQVYYPIDDNKKAEEVTHGIWRRKSSIPNAALSTQSASYPLVIFSHGFQGDRFGNSWLAEALVANGYIVVMIDHAQNTSYDQNDLFVYTSMWQRPLDMTYLLTYLFDHAHWGKYIDKERVVAGGFSLGGLTSLWLGGIQAEPENFKKVMNDKYARWVDWPQSSKEKAAAVDWTKALQSYQDPRIKAVFALAPDLGEAFKVDGLQQQKVPTLVLVGDKDMITPLKTNAGFYADSIPNTRLLVIKGASHFTFMNKCSLLGNRITPHLCQDKVDRQKIHDFAGKEIIKFLTDTFSHTND